MNRSCHKPHAGSGATGTPSTKRPRSRQGRFRPLAITHRTNQLAVRFAIAANVTQFVVPNLPVPVTPAADATVAARPSVESKPSVTVVAVIACATELAARQADVVTVETLIAVVMEEVATRVVEKSCAVRATRVVGTLESGVSQRPMWQVRHPP